MSDTAGLIADLSHYQTSVDLAAMKAGGIAAVILKASQGTRFTDPVFASRAQAAAAVGLLVGAYHFFDPSADPAGQASYFMGIAAAAGVKVLAVDFEPSKAGDGEANAAAICASIQAATGRWPLLYTGRWVVAPANAIFSACPLWMAEWTTAATPKLPPGFSTWQMWQFESGLNDVPGVVGACSRSRFNGELADLQGWWSQSVPPPPPAEEETFTIPVPTEVIGGKGTKAKLSWKTPAAAAVVAGMAGFGGGVATQSQSVPTQTVASVPSVGPAEDVVEGAACIGPLSPQTHRCPSIINIPFGQLTRSGGASVVGPSAQDYCPPGDLRRRLRNPPLACILTIEPTTDAGR